MNGFELAGRAIKVGHITERTNDQANPNSYGGVEFEEPGKFGNILFEALRYECNPPATFHRVPIS